MVRITRKFINLIAFSFLWVLTRSLQFVFEVFELIDEACAISNAELGLQIKVQEEAKGLLTMSAKVY